MGLDRSIDTSVLGDSEIQSEDLPEELGFNFRVNHSTRPITIMCYNIYYIPFERIGIYSSFHSQSFSVGANVFLYSCRLSTEATSKALTALFRFASGLGIHRQEQASIFLCPLMGCSGSTRI